MATPLETDALGSAGGWLVDDILRSPPLLDTDVLAATAPTAPVGVWEVDDILRSTLALRDTDVLAATASVGGWEIDDILRSTPAALDTDVLVAASSVAGARPAMDARLSSDVLAALPVTSVDALAS